MHDELSKAASAKILARNNTELKLDIPEKEAPSEPRAA
jgi:hypothetical protein